MAARRLGLLFPGQGSQRAGMGRDLAAKFEAARLVFEESDEALGEHLSRLMFATDDDSAKRLTSTVNAQPALLTASIAVLAALREEAGLDVSECSCALGHSLGEYTALVAAGSCSLVDGVRLVRARGAAMQAAADVIAEPVTMAAVMPLSKADAMSVCEDVRSICSVANVNADSQVVLSGTQTGVQRAIAVAKERHGARRAVSLEVSAPFHSPLMAPARESLLDALGKVEFSPPVLPVVSNVTARVMEANAKSMRELLLQQLTMPVLWSECVACAVAPPLGARRLLEVGVGTQVLTALVPKIAAARSAEVDAVFVCTPEQLLATAVD